MAEEPKTPKLLSYQLLSPIEIVYTNMVESWAYDLKNHSPHTWV